MVFLLVVICLLLGLVILLLPQRGGMAGPPEYPEDIPTPVAGEQKPRETPRPAETEQTIPPEVSRPRDKVRGRVALVLDDAGNSLADLQPFLRAKIKLTIAVLPGLVYSAESARLASSSGKEVILHQPLEAVGGNALGPGGILTFQADEEIKQILAENIANLPALVGMNNHMGSLATADVRVMDILMQVLKQHGLFFLDSRTTAETVAPESARLYGVPLLSRDVFLDNVIEQEAIAGRLEEGLQVALSRGTGILIGHVHNALVMEVIYQNLPRFDKEGIEFVFLSELL